MKSTDQTRIHEALTDAAFRAYREAVIRLPPNVLRVIEQAAAAETNPVARGEFANILKNIALAEKRGVPMCQDTGVPVVYLTIPRHKLIIIFRDSGNLRSRLNHDVR